MSRLELSIAWRYLRSRGSARLFSFISVIAIGGVLVGVSALIVINGVMTGMQTDLREKILVGSPDLRVLTFGDDLKVDNWQPTLARVKRNPRIVAAAPFVLTQGLATAGHDYAEGVFLEGIPPAGPGVADVTTIRKHATTGDFRFATEDGQHRGAVLGKRLAERLNVYPGSKLTLISPAGVKFNAAAGGYVPRLYQFEVTGVFETGMYEYDNSYVYVDLDQAKEFAGIGNAVTGIEARTRNRWDAGDVAKQLADTLGYPYRVTDWQEANSQLFQALKLEKLAMRLILLLIVLVAAFNIVSTLTMVVKDKTREIGILKAMGLPARSVRRIFLAQGLVIGFVGTAIGVVIGVTAGIVINRGKLIPLDPTVYFIDHLPVAIQLDDVIW
ncbi:MAG TPA: FtsX-like permease family protein, partial [Gemmatimonadaceae bacterium]|nr:FtsX-like permease family protein [Gemmatimonadaceae bacterium]